jgi:hypothetical protein
MHSKAKKHSRYLLVSLMLFVLLGCNLPVLATTTATPEQAPTGVPDDLNPPSLPTDSVQVFLVKTEDGGQSGTPVGCNDSLVAMSTAMPVGENPLVSAYAALFAIREERVGSVGYYNALHSADLSVATAAIDGQGNAVVDLQGTLLLGGVCDSPRVKAQLEAAARQFPQVKAVQITINGQPLDQVLSGQ